MNTRRFTPRPMLALAVAAAGMAFSSSAHAVDGCKVLLCMAGSWRNIAACVPEVTKALRDLARGRVIPRCKMADGSYSSGGGFNYRQVWGNDCPYYFRRFTWYSDPTYASGPEGSKYGWWTMECEFDWVAELTINGQPWKRSYIGPSGSLEEYQPAARAALQLGNQPIEVDLREQAWIAAGSPRRAPAPPEGHTDLLKEGYVSCLMSYSGGDGESGRYSACRQFHWQD